MTQKESQKKDCPKGHKNSMIITIEKQPDGSFVEIWRCMHLESSTYPGTEIGLDEDDWEYCNHEEPVIVTLENGRLIRR